MKKIILASASPRRKSILESMGLAFTIQPSDFEENLKSDEFSYSAIEYLAEQKALTIENPNCDIVISADTVVVLDNKILGKPKDREEAYSMLKKLEGKIHQVVTAICVTNREKTIVDSITSTVEFEHLSDEMILNYIDTYKPFDKAGSYGIQELPQGFIKNVEGSLENIIGLCPKALDAILQQFL